MKNLTFALLSLALSFNAFAGGTVVLMCASKPNQSINKMDGYRVVSDKGLILQSLEGGRVVASDNLNGKMQEMTQAQVAADKDISMFILGRAGVNVSKVQKARFIAVSSGEPATLLVNYFDKNNTMLTGALLIPAGGMVMCYNAKTPAI